MDKESQRPSSSSSAAFFAAMRIRNPVSGVRITTGFKLWLLMAILLLALWSVFTGSVSLKGFFGSCGGGGLCYISGGDDVDTLEVEEREKVVRMMWDVYARGAGRGGRVMLPRFWREAFDAAYECLVNDSPEARNAAVSDIAKLSLTLHSFKLEPLSAQSSKNMGGESATKKSI
ncbi:PREDICTED: uncharacterized protein LOC104809062 [Tarenaya hassleriana]|uniref:uncharacterized protein LOC104809062 n=1 Tax=Tarenaya hassleriana TaxID=28532 RepID=UPI00053C13D0|nr:PREDICTED: uncharacterized protein LOC104809062 [Tarenaya hassleriana]